MTITDERVQRTEKNKGFFERLETETLHQLYQHRDFVKSMLLVSDYLHKADFESGNIPSEEELKKHHLDTEHEMKLHRTLNSIEDRIKELEGKKND